MKRSIRKAIAALIGILILISGVALICYPFISNYLMSLNHSSEIEQQEQGIKQADESQIEEAFLKAEEYNKTLLGNVVLTDPFDPGFRQEIDEEYESLLNINQDSIMASIEVPRIDISIPVYHGTSQEVLEKGIGHLQKTSLPIGGKGTHAVLTGHTALSESRLFSDLDKLEKGDIFYIHVLDEILAYQVDLINVVEPTDTKDLRVIPGEDYVTLITCTPYGINSHRLLVRGTRISYEEAVIIEETTEQVQSTWMIEYKRALLIGVAACITTVLVFCIVCFLNKNKKGSKKEK